MIVVFEWLLYGSFYTIGNVLVNKAFISSYLLLFPFERLLGMGFLSK